MQFMLPFILMSKVKILFKFERVCMKALISLVTNNMFIKQKDAKS